MVETLSRERTELNTLALTLDARAAAVTDALKRQGTMVTQAADLAETQLREAEASLAGRAADLAAAAGEAIDASRVASEDLGRQVARLETAGVGVGDQMRALEDGLTQQRAALVTVAHALRAEQEDFATLAESRTAQLAEFVSLANTDVTSLNDATTRGAKSLSDLIAEAQPPLPRTGRGGDRRARRLRPVGGGDAEGPLRSRRPGARAPGIRDALDHRGPVGGGDRGAGGGRCPRRGGQGAGRSAERSRLLPPARRPTRCSRPGSTRPKA